MGERKLSAVAYICWRDTTHFRKIRLTIMCYAIPYLLAHIYILHVVSVCADIIASNVCSLGILIQICVVL